MIRIVGFIGNIKVGKTTAAKYLVEQGYVRLRFAQALKDMLEFGLNIPNEYIDGSKKNEPCEQLCWRTTRHAMMTLGTEWGRNMIHPDIWVKALERELFLEIEQGGYNFVIDDFRFLSEVEWLRNLKLVSQWPLELQNKWPIEQCIIRIIRGSEKIIEHQSEIEQGSIKSDWAIFNNDSVESMYKSIDEVLEFIFKKE